MFFVIPEMSSKTFVNQCQDESKNKGVKVLNLPEFMGQMIIEEVQR